MTPCGRRLQGQSGPFTCGKSAVGVFSGTPMCARHLRGCENARAQAGGHKLPHPSRRFPSLHMETRNTTALDALGSAIVRKATEDCGRVQDTHRFVQQLLGTPPCSKCGWVYCRC